jgi:hypothetical protein
MPESSGRRVLLDENVDRLIQPLFDSDHYVTHVDAHGWKGIENGELLRVAALELDVFVTMDKNLQFQQNLAMHDLAIVVIHSVSNAFVAVFPLMAKINEAVRMARPGTAAVVAH